MKIQNLIYTVGAVCLLSTAMMWSDALAQSLMTNDCGDNPHWVGGRCVGYGRGTVPSTCCATTTGGGSGGGNTNLRVDDDPVNGGFNPDNPVEPKYYTVTECNPKEDSDGNITYCCKDSTIGGI